MSTMLEEKIKLTGGHELENESRNNNKNKERRGGNSEKTIRRLLPVFKNSSKPCGIRHLSSFPGGQLFSKEEKIAFFLSNKVMKYNTKVNLSRAVIFLYLRGHHDPHGVCESGTLLPAGDDNQRVSDVDEATRFAEFNSVLHSLLHINIPLIDASFWKYEWIERRRRLESVLG